MNVAEWFEIVALIWLGALAAGLGIGWRARGIQRRRRASCDLPGDRFITLHHHQAMRPRQ